MRDDSDLLQVFATAKSEDAFAELVRRHIRPVYAVALRRVGGDTHLAHDITQEVFTAVARKASALAGNRALVGWLFVATRYAAAKTVRREQQRRRLSESARLMSETGAAGATEPAWDALRPVLDDAIDELSERDRAAVLLYYFEQRTFADVGSKLSLSENGARMRVERALEKLRRSLSRRGITSTAAALAGALQGQAVAAVPANLAALVSAGAITASAAGGGAAAILTFMTITKTQLSAALGLVLAGAATISALQHREIEALRDKLAEGSAEAGRRTAELTVQLKQTERLLAMARNDTARPNNVMHPTSIARPAADDVKVIKMKDVIREHPEFEGLQRKELRRSIVRQYKNAFDALALTDSQLATLKDLLVERAISSSDASAIALDAGVPRNSPEFRRADAQATASADQAIAALIGRDGLEKLEALSGVMNTSFNAMNNAEIDMIDVGLPASVEQSRSLAQLYRALDRAQKDRPRDFSDMDPVTHLRPFDRALAAEAATFLTPAQVAVLKSSLAVDNQRDSILRPYTDIGTAAAIMFQ